MHTSMSNYTFFCKTLCYITPPGNTVQQQCGKQAIGGWQTVHGVFSRALRNPAKLQIMLTKSCKIFFTKRFSSTMDTKLIMLHLFRQNLKFKSGSPGPPRNKTGGPRPMRPPVPPPTVCMMPNYPCFDYAPTCWPSPWLVLEDVCKPDCSVQHFWDKRLSWTCRSVKLRYISPNQQIWSQILSKICQIAKPK